MHFYQDQLEAGDALADQQAAFEASLTSEQRELLYRLDQQRARKETPEIGANQIEVLIDLLNNSALNGAPNATPNAKPKATPSTVTLGDLVDLWATDTQAKPAMQYNWGKTVGKLEDYLTANDRPILADKVTRADMIGWKDHRLNIENLAPRTVGHGLAIVKTIYSNALVNDRLTRKDNPAEGVRVAIRPNPLDKVRPYNDSEASAPMRSDDSALWCPAVAWSWRRWGGRGPARVNLLSAPVH
jgi:hypothetical protein